MGLRQMISIYSGSGSIQYSQDGLTARIPKGLRVIVQNPFNQPITISRNFYDDNWKLMRESKLDFTPNDPGITTNGYSNEEFKMELYSKGLEIPCENSGECQSQFCYEGKCALFNNKPCQWDSNCASNYCAGMDGKGGMVGTCKALPKEGKPLGEWCYKDDACASRTCRQNRCVAVSQPKAGSETGTGTGAGIVTIPTEQQQPSEVYETQPQKADTSALRTVAIVAFVAIIGGIAIYAIVGRK